MSTRATLQRPVPAVAAVMIEDGKILLIRRAVEPSKGKWSIPGGSVEWGETLVEALKREVREETGLETEVGDVAGVFDLIVNVETRDSGLGAGGSGFGACETADERRCAPTWECQTSCQEPGAREGDKRHEPRIAYHYVIIDYFARAVGGDLRPGDDAAEVRWVPLAELDKYELTDHLRERLGEMELT